MKLALHRWLLVLLMLCSPAVFAQDAYPNRPIKIIVPFGAGGGFQTLVEILRPTLLKELGQALVVEDRPGAAGAIGTRAVIASPPDGYTLLMQSSSVTINQILSTDTGFDVRTDLKPITNMAFSPFVLTVKKNVPARTLGELVAYAKANPGKLNFASAGIGTTSHIAGELVKRALDIQVEHIPYKGSGPVIAAIATGEVDLTMEFANNLRQYVDTGSARFLPRRSVTARCPTCRPLPKRDIRACRSAPGWPCSGRRSCPMRSRTNCKPHSPRR